MTEPKRMKEMNTSDSLPLLPGDIGDIETKVVLKKLTKAHQALAELKGVASSIPNQGILINTLSLQEAKDSSAIENIITTQDDLYRSDRQARQFVTVAAKEVYSYATALSEGFEQVRASGLLTERQILEIQATIEGNSAGFRKLPGTALKNDATGETIYTPPQSYEEIKPLMANLEKFINDESGASSGCGRGQKVKKDERITPSATEKQIDYDCTTSREPISRSSRMVIPLRRVTGSNYTTRLSLDGITTRIAICTSSSGARTE